MTAERVPRIRLSWLLSVGLFGWMVVVAARQWSAAAWPPLEPRPAWLALAGLALAAHFALACEAWRRWLALLGAPIAYADAFRTLFVSNVAKYLPGGGWNYLDRALRLRALGVGPAVAAGSMALDLACQLAAAAIVGALALSAGGSPVGAWAPLAAIALVAGLHPRVLGSALGLAERLSGRPFPRPPYRYGAMLGQLARYLLAWIFLGLGFAALVEGLLPAPSRPPSALALAGTFPLAWAAGTLALFVPAGFGVREGALALLLAPLLHAPWPMTLAVAARLWLVLGETAALVTALLWRSPVRVDAPMGTRDL